MRFIIIMFLFMALPLSASEPSSLEGQAILLKAKAAAGGDEWANARTLVLKGHAVFWGKNGPEPTSAPDSYVMYREFDPNRTSAHGAEGKLRIIVSNNGKPLWTVGFDGTTSWNEKGVIPKEQADAYWASNFGYGIIRHALKPGFVAERLADSNVNGHPVYMVRLTDPAKTESLFGIDQKSYAIRMVGFSTPRGWHVRTYDKFFKPPSMPNWLQAGTVTLYYNGAKQNEVHWHSAKINGFVDPAMFVVPKQF